MNTETVVLIFAQSAQEEQKFGSLANRRALVEELNLAVVKTVKKTGLPYFLFTEKEQTGNSFGERFTAAIQQLFAQGYQRVITVGNDTPELKKEHLLAAAKHSGLVLGPSADGGFYLMGISEAQFDVAAFLRLSWKRPSLRKELCNHLNSQGVHVVLLETLRDADTVTDLKKLLALRSAISDSILMLISSLLHFKIVLPEARQITGAITFRRKHFNKGSPLLA